MNAKIIVKNKRTNEIRQLNIEEFKSQFQKELEEALRNYKNQEEQKDMLLPPFMHKNKNYKSDFYFDLPEELIAQDPLEDRSSSRLLCLYRQCFAISRMAAYVRSSSFTLLFRNAIILSRSVNVSLVPRSYSRMTFLSAACIAFSILLLTVTGTVFLFTMYCSAT